MSKDYSVLYNNITGQAYFIKNKCKNSEENPEKKEMNKQFDNFYNFHVSTQYLNLTSLIDIHPNLIYRLIPIIFYYHQC